jgi:hypothetical protein
MMSISTPVRVGGDEVALAEGLVAQAQQIGTPARRAGRGPASTSYDLEVDERPAARPGRSRDGRVSPWEEREVTDGSSPSEGGRTNRFRTSASCEVADVEAHGGGDVVDPSARGSSS